MSNRFACEQPERLHHNLQDKLHQEYSMSRTESFVFCALICLSTVSMVACAATEQDTRQPAPVYFSDCSLVNLQGADGRNMTREELIAAEENTLLEALDDNSECKQKALTAGQQAVSAVGSSQGQGGAIGAQNNGSRQSNGATGQPLQNNHAQQQTQQVIRAGSAMGGGKTGVQGKEITVCQISQENLAAATTSEDRKFWQGEVDKNCN